MREQLNENPLAQAALVVALLLVAVFVFIKPFGGGGEEESGEAVTAAPAAPELELETAAAPPPSGTPRVPSNRLPAPVEASIAAGTTTVLLIVKREGIDDGRVEDVVEDLSTRSDIATFIVPVDEVARYTAVTQPVDLQRSPALIVVRPGEAGQPPKAAVSYGFQTIESAVQAVVDAQYRGPELPYHP